ncbi:phosphoglycolate phosphatase [Thermofilum pendens]|uniref:Phosphoglycolate phosphatase n=1 Tax=Thermofilum pendens (strain DSM 2475 / Hrk 5) TaxID=368408 RepID=A1S0P8_THEPD|nr:phosphoglycolate phosphatase [Thermofilum pendens]ABL79028.1 SPP-like hydrolase [Thermofilum pendens Hrk 5]
MARVAVFVDVDWTLTDRERRISSRVVEALERLQREGYFVVLASATAYPIVYGLSRYLPTSGVAVGENGGVVGDGRRLEILGRIDKELVLRVARERLSCCLEDSWQNLFRFVDVTFALRKGVDPGYAVGEARHVFGAMGLEVKYSGVALHVHPPGVNKGVGLRKALEMLGGGFDYVVAVGDSEVDVDMFRVADFSACPAHAPEEVKKEASYVAKAPYSDGFLEIVDVVLRGAGKPAKE